MPSVVEQLVHSTRRRWIVRHAIEYSAVGFAGGCGVAIALMSIRLMHAESVFSLAAIFPSIGGLCGLLVAFRSAPSIAEVVQQTDAVLGDDDLISTAWQLNHSSDHWHRTVCALATARCATARPAQIVPHRISTRGWSAIGLSISCVAVLCAFSVIGPGNRAVATAASERHADDWTTWAKAPDQPSSPTSSTPSTALEAKAETTPESRSISGDPSVAITSPHEQTTSGHIAGDGSGPGNATSADAAARAPDWASQSDSAALPSTHVTKTSGLTSASGIGQPTASGGNGTAVGIVQVVATSDNSMPAWGQIGPPVPDAADITTADAQRIPSRYRDLARSYFAPVR